MHAKDRGIQNINAVDGFGINYGHRKGDSAILNNLLDNPVLLRVEKDVQKIEKGETVDVVLLDI